MERFKAVPKVNFNWPGISKDCAMTQVKIAASTDEEINIFKSRKQSDATAIVDITDASNCDNFDADRYGKL